MSHKQEFFKITSLHRDDIKYNFPNVSPKIIDNISDEQMLKLASDMENDYCEQLFHQHLKLFVKSYNLIDIAREKLSKHAKAKLMADILEDKELLKLIKERLNK